MGARRRSGWGLWVWAWLLLVGFVPAQAALSDFPNPAGLRPQVEFWKKVFADWSENQIAIHDNLYLDKVYHVVDLRPLAASGASEDTLYRTRKQMTEVEKDRIDRILRKLHAYRGKPESLPPEERKIWNLFGDVSASNRFLTARQRVRAQQGLQGRFQRGIEISRRYLPHMEEMFRREGLPLELTRMPFVESTFNIKAYSKVGAAGIWQFIPSSARIYGLAMNEIVDDRRDPLLATRAAARHLRDDYARLQSWPLAVTAYNHGRGGIAKAVRDVGTTDFMTILNRYRGRAFGFASRNFYASFLAALEVERSYEQHFGRLQLEPKLAFDTVTIRDYVSFPTLARLAGTDPAVLHDLNPAFERVVVEGKLYVPRGHSLRIPAGKAAGFETAYAGLPAAERFAAQRRYYAEHRVMPGQTLGALARRYGSSVSAIQAANGLRSSSLIRAGQILKIPTGGKGGAPAPPAVAAPSSPRPASGSRPTETANAGEHRVASGDTVLAIARRYGTTVAAVQAANGLESAHRIRPGQVLKIPGGSSATRSTSSFVRHRVEPGQTLGAIARRYGTTVGAIQAANELRSVHQLRIGQVLKIPSG